MEYYYQIKGKTSKEQGEYSGFFGSNSNWVFPPVFSGKVEAATKKEAKELIEIEYNKKFPLRVLNKDLDSNEFLLNITEITDNRTKQLFELKECKQCGISFKQIDLYNDFNAKYKGSEFCSYECKEEYNSIKRFEYNQSNNLQGNNQPVIYKITNRENNKCYIGKTTQVFTLRWYQHFYQSKGTKFHDAIHDSSLCDWIFEIIEVIIVEKDKFKSKDDIDKYIFERESYWINHFDSINNGYNSLISDKNQKQDSNQYKLDLLS